MEIYFGYDKKQVIQALRYHFISRPEVKILLIVVNVFTIISASLFFFRKVSPLAFLVASLLWMVLMISFWFILPKTVYKRASTFRDTFKMSFSEHHVLLENARGQMQWAWKNFSRFVESPHFFHLYFDSRSFFLVPKAALEDNERTDLRQLFKEKIGE
ncbi:YcxB family protein [Aridibaculum aurantiacum]|uniref:YcxB family protein n=1 Tax=Aridibaculum aurantiacum TaxID=2810307 RepID=UPI001A95F365|nr:YcxB family protein [Aridibaculum aurantiacum]